MHRLQQIRALVPVGPFVQRPIHRGRLAAVSALVAAGTTALVWVLASLLSGAGAQPSALSPSAAKAKAKAARAYGKLPLRFEANRGQTDSQVKFLSRGAGYTLFLTPREAVISLSHHGSDRGARHDSRSQTTNTDVLRMRLAGANPRPQVAGVGRLPGASSYLRGRDAKRSQTGVPGYAKVGYSGVYPGVDLLYHGQQGSLEYDFRVAPGADPGRIALSFSGARKLSLDPHGDLLLRTSAGALRQHKPVIYQTVAGVRRPVAGHFVLRGHSVGFQIGRYDHSRALVIDPALAYSTYLGGATGGNGLGNVVAVDSSGSAYVAGATSAADFPTTSGAFDRTRAGPPSSVFAEDVFVTKLNPAGDALVYSTYLGGDYDDEALGVALDSSGRAYVTGHTQSFDSFPLTANAFQSTPLAFDNAFVSVLKADGSGLDYSTLLGGSDFNKGLGIAVDSSGAAYVTGTTQGSDFPTKAPSPATPLHSSKDGDFDGFVAKFDPDASTGANSLVFSTYLGGGTGSGIAVDSAGDTEVVGGAGMSFATKNGFQATTGPDGAGFMAKLNPTGSALAYATFIEGAAPSAIALDPSGHAYVTGTTTSADLPTKNAFQAKLAGTSDAFVAKLDPAASGAGSLVYSSYLGGAGGDSGSGIAVTPSGTAYVAGRADDSPEGVPPPGSFPTVDPLAPGATRPDAFVSAVRPDGSGLSFSTYLGGGGLEQVGGVALDGSGNAYVAGNASSTDFPTRNAFQAENRGRGVDDRRETFVAKLAPVGAAAPLVTGLGRRSGPAGTSVVISGHGFAGASAVRFGATTASSFAVDSDGQITATAPSGPSGPVAVTVTTAQGTSPANPIATFTYAQGTWDLTGSLRVGRFEEQTATSLSDGRVLVAGGVGGGASTVVAAAELYDPSSATWGTTQSMGTARAEFTANLLPDGRVLVAGGVGTGGGQLNSAELYDPANGTWSSTGSMAQARSLHTATVLANGKILVAAGRGTTGSPLDSAEVYDPTTETWSPAGSLHDARIKHTATLLPNGKILVAGGIGASGSPIASAEVYEPATNSWATTGSLGAARTYHTATRLADGRVLVTGGAFFLQTLNSAEIYDPTSGNFTSTSAMEHPRSGAAAARLSDGRILVTGGSQTNSKDNTADLYDPTTSQWASAGVMTRYRGFESSSQDVFALPLASRKVLVGGDARSAGSTTELYNPAGPGLPPPGPGQGAGSSGLTSSGTTGASDTTAPGVSGYGLTNNPFVVGGRTPTFGSAAKAKKRHKKGTTFRYTLSEAATVKIVIAQRLAGRRRGKRCVAPTRRLRKAKKCTRITTKGTLTRISKQGANKVAFSEVVSKLVEL